MADKITVSFFISYHINQLYVTTFIFNMNSLVGASKLISSLQQILSTTHSYNFRRTDYIKHCLK